jgi:hypothetical protein
MCHKKATQRAGDSDFAFAWGSGKDKVILYPTDFTSFNFTPTPAYGGVF